MDRDGTTVKDLSRPTFSRPSGEVGLYIDFYDVTPENRHHYGSPQFMIADFVEKLYEQLLKIPLVDIKNEFERNGVLDGVIIERWQRGSILALGFDTQEAIAQMWRDYENHKIEPVMKQFLNTPKLLKAIEAKKITLRARMWQDEVDAAHLELERILIRPFSLDSKANDIAMMRQAREYQKNQFYNISESLRDEYSLMDSKLSELTSLFRQSLPPKVTEISTFAEFDSYAIRLFERNEPFKKPYKEYLHMRKRIAEVTTIAQTYLVGPLLQVHGVVETEHQRELKQRMREECANNHSRLCESYDWSNLKHPEYQKKLILREHVFFLGMASVIGAGMDTLYELDEQLDEYWSGVASHIKLN